MDSIVGYLHLIYFVGTLTSWMTCNPKTAHTEPAVSTSLSIDGICFLGSLTGNHCPPLYWCPAPYYWQAKGHLTACEGPMQAWASWRWKEYNHNAAIRITAADTQCLFWCCTGVFVSAPTEDWREHVVLCPVFTVIIVASCVIHCCYAIAGLRNEIWMGYYEERLLLSPA